MKIFTYGLVFFLSCIDIRASDETPQADTSEPSKSFSEKEMTDVLLARMKEQCVNAIKIAKAKKPDAKAAKRIDEASDFLTNLNDSDVSREAKIASFACCVMKTMGNYRCSVSTIKEQVKNKLSQFFE